jgi:hypothetical protein
MDFWKASIAALALLLVAHTAACSEVRGRVLASLAVTTSAGTTRYISNCNLYPPVDSGLSLAPGDTDSLTSATAAITTGGQPDDILVVNPALPTGTVSCNSAGICTPCPGLSVLGNGGTNVTISGAGTAAEYQACLHQVAFRSSALPGQEGLGDRTITFTVNDAAGVASATKIVTFDAADDAACAAYRDSYSITLTTGAPAGFYPVPFDAACSGGACNAVLIAPAATITAGSKGAVGSLQIHYTFGRAGSAGTPAPAEDRFGFLPDAADPASTPANPCPGLSYRRLIDPNGLTLMEVSGPASPALYTACVRRAFYANIAPAGTATLGQRPLNLRIYSSAYYFQTVIEGAPVAVNAPTTAGICSTAGTAACIGPAPTDEELPPVSDAPAVPTEPSPSPAAGSASPSPASGGISTSASSTPNVGNGAVGVNAVAVASSAAAALFIAVAVRDAFCA